MTLIVCPRPRFEAAIALLPARFTERCELGSPAPCNLDGTPYTYPAGDPAGAASPAVCWDDHKFDRDDYARVRAIARCPAAKLNALRTNTALRDAIRDGEWRTVRQIVAEALSTEVDDARKEIDPQEAR